MKYNVPEKVLYLFDKMCIIHIPVSLVHPVYNVPYKVDTARERDCLKC